MSETSNPRRDYFEYLENVLGIKSILQSKDSLSKTSMGQTDLLFCIENYHTYTEEESNLLHKMIAAVKVDPTRLKVCDLSDASNFQAECLVIFIDHEQVQGSPIAASLTVQTFSPRVLVKKPELKKQAWTELQKVLQYFT